ncbi:ABC transporter ATP-binding protein [Chengkuizengella axinellae]|uniref:ABC transporter ATP-binding protein n=1 Tax=Chengkuizengella axinellae TaxID=3064388 RepID=A0ABT9J1P7_9BACL|nr:ABC transporter ATP-binding protein [Chengkuizengella sp. 2205SS18-9]MDP5275541.1 ABC transporter ATP-binding protein [Chengkuizengella sp. 2205SS18-9]
MSKLLEIKDLYFSFDTFQGEVEAIRGINFEVNKGEVVALVGESGSGKSVTSQAIIGLNPMPPGRYKQGSINFDNKDLTSISEKEFQKIRGAEVSMIFQDPMTSLNPTMKIGTQITESLIKHQGMSKSEAKQRAIEMLGLVGIPNPDKLIYSYPHQFSGGMRQRVMIAIALACNPKLLIADEPTTALDVTIQAQIIELMKGLQDKLHTSIILITHDLGVVANIAQRVVIMYAGKIVEQGTLNEIFYESRHPYTWGLLESVPRLDSKEHGRLASIPGTPPQLIDPPKGCPFAERCEFAMKACIEEFPEETTLSSSHKVSCWLEDPAAPTVERPVQSGGHV